MIAEVTLRELGRPTLEELLLLTALICRNSRHAEAGSPRASSSATCNTSRRPRSRTLLWLPRCSGSWAADDTSRSSRLFWT
jgi:hypothetical protein